MAIDYRRYGQVCSRKAWQFKTSLCLNIRKYKLTGLANRRTYKPLKKLNDAHYRFIDNAMAENDELSAPKLYAT